MAEPDGKGFWTSLPGVLTALAAMVTALTGAWLAIPHGRKDNPATVAPVDAAERQAAVPDATAPAQTVTGHPPAASAGTNLIAADNGGTLVFSGNAQWDKMIDGDDDHGAQIGEQAGDFGVFAFRDGIAARIDAFTTMVPEASSYNPTAIELSYATASEDGPFTPIGVFEIRNGRVAPDGRQVYRFAPVVARFLKVKLRTARIGTPYVMAYEFGALGTPTGQTLRRD